MSKHKAFANLLKQVSIMLEDAEHQRKKAQEAANSHKGAMESRYDTFKEEAQYLASAHMKRINDIKRAKTILKQLLSNSSVLDETHSKVGVASIVTISDEGDHTKRYLISPVMGGEKVRFSDDSEETLTVLTPSAPLGAKIINKEEGDDFIMKIDDVNKEFVIESIQ